LANTNLLTPLFFERVSILRVASFDASCVKINMAVGVGKAFLNYYYSH